MLSKLAARKNSRQETQGVSYGQEVIPAFFNVYSAQIEWTGQFLRALINSNLYFSSEQDTTQ